MKDFKLVHAYFVNKKLKELSEEEYKKTKLQNRTKDEQN